MRLLDYDPFYGISTYFKQEDGKNIISEVQDVEPFLDLNKRIGEGLNKKGNLWMVGEIPLSICYQWALECGHKAFSKDWQEYARKKLNDSDYRKFNQANIKL